MNQSINPSTNDIPAYLRRGYKKSNADKEILSFAVTMLVLLVISIACWYFVFFPINSAHAAAPNVIVGSKEMTLNTFCGSVIQERAAAHDTEPLTGDLLKYCGN